MMSAKKIQANRQNALKSTGPRTPEGKAAVRHNALRHGLLSKEVLLPGEDKEVLRELGERLREELQPVGELEHILVDRIIACYWRLRRLGRVETGIFAWELYGELSRRAYQEASNYTKQVGGLADLYDDPLRPTTRITNKGKYQEALSRAEEMKAAQEEDLATLGRTFARDAEQINAFSKLSRYETAIERQLYRALHELERRQVARRADGDVSPPVAIDVDVSGISREEH